MTKFRLGNVCRKIGSGATPRGGSRVYQDSGVALIRSQNVYNNDFNWDGLAFINEEHADQLSNVIVHAGDVLLNITGESVGRVAQAPPKALPARVNQHVAIIRPDPQVLDPSYLRFYLASRQMQERMLSMASAGATRKALTKGMIENFEISAPPLGAQQEIVRVLGSFEAKMKLNHRMNRTLEDMARAIFKSWFVDFDPVKAKAGGRQPFGMDGETAALFPDEFANSEAGSIPKGWRSASVYEIANVVYGAPFSSEYFNEQGHGLPLLKIRDLKTQNPKTFTNEEHPKGEKIVPGDIVVGMDGEFRVHIWKGPVAWLNQRVCKFIPGENVPTVFLALSLHEPMAFFERAKTGTTVIHLLKRDIDTIQIIIPSRAVLQAFAQLTDPLIRRQISNAKESGIVVETRNALLPKLMSGEIGVGETEEGVKKETAI